MDTVSGLDDLIQASERQICVLRKEIDQLQNDITTLKTRRNMCTSRLVQLPTELIARILSFAQCAPQESRPSRLEGMVVLVTPWVNFDLRWTRCMRVCRRLREVGVGSPQLWSLIWYPMRASQARMALYIERAKNCPLDLYGSGFSSRDWESILHAPHIRRCLQTARRIHIPQPTREQSTESGGSFVEQRMPQVETLYCSHDSDDLPCHHFSPHFLGGLSHTLRSLTLHRVAFSSTSGAPELPALTYLDVHVFPHERPQHVDQLAELLRGAPSLETLAIQCSINMVAHTSDPVSLPHLHTLKLSGSVNDLADIIRPLHTPSRRLYVNTHGQPEDTTIVQNFVLSFWAATAGSSRLPDGCCIRGSHDHYTLSFGSTFDIAPSGCYPVPRLHFTIGTTRPLDIGVPLTSVTTMVYRRCMLDNLDATLPIRVLSLRHIVMDGALVGNVFVDQLFNYLRERVAARCPVVSIRCLYKPGTDIRIIKELAEALEKEDLGCSVAWTRQG